MSHDSAYGHVSLYVYAHRVHDDEMIGSGIIAMRQVIPDLTKAERDLMMMKYVYVCL